MCQEQARRANSWESRDVYNGIMTWLCGGSLAHEKANMLFFQLEDLLSERHVSMRVKLTTVGSGA